MATFTSRQRSVTSTSSIQPPAAVNFFASTASPFGTLTNTAPAGSGIWAADYYDGGFRYDYNGNFQQQVGFYGTNQLQTDQSSDVWDANFGYYDLFKFDQYGDELGATFVPGAIGLTIWGVDNPNPPAQDTQDYYSFSLSAGQSATAVVESLNGQNAQISIVDGNGNVLASGVSGASNVSESISNFVAPYSGKFYVEITGDPGVQYSVTVTRSATFSIQPHNSYSTAENLTGTTASWATWPRRPVPFSCSMTTLQSAVPDLADRPDHGRVHRSAIAAPATERTTRSASTWPTTGPTSTTTTGRVVRRQHDLQDRPTTDRVVVAQTMPRRDRCAIRALPT